MKLRQIISPLQSKIKGRQAATADRGHVLSQGIWNANFNQACTEDDIYYCFRLLLGRYPSEVEWAGHKAQAGGNLTDIVASYLSCREFKNRKLLTASDLSNSELQLVNLDAFKMYVSIADTAVGKYIYETKTYEPEVTGPLSKVIVDGMNFVDIGANIGYFSMLAATLVGKRGKVFAFEPFQFNVKLVSMNAHLNGLNNIVIYPFAVSDKVGLVAYDNFGSNGVISQADPDPKALLATTLVYATTLDETLRNVEHIDVLKLDIEGAEYLALTGARELLAAHRPTIFTEFSPPFLQATSKVDAEAYLRLLLVDERYTISVLSRQGNVIDCGRDVARIIGLYNASGSDHIDIAAYPNGNGR